jgi:hypothetical protein
MATAHVGHNCQLGLAVREGELRPQIGYVGSPPRNRAFRRELEAELDRMRTFLGLAS